MRYQIVSTTGDLEHFADLVRGQLLQGWEPQGGPFSYVEMLPHPTLINTVSPQRFFAQAMTKNAGPEETP